MLAALEAALATGSPILVHVTATWCEVCQVQKPIVASLLARPDFAGLTFFDVDFDTQRVTLRRLAVQTHATMIVFRDRTEVDRQVGQTDPEVIEALVRKVI